MRHLDQQRPDSARCGMNERRFAPFQRISVISKILRCHPLQHCGRSIALSYSIGNLHQPFGWHSGILGVASENRAVGHTIADSQPVRILA